MVDEINAKNLLGANYEQARLTRELSKIARLETEGASTTPKDEKEITKAAKDFEALLLHQMFQAMWASVPEGDFFGGSQEGKYFRDMLIEGVSNTVAQGQGIGVKDVIIKDLGLLED